jgi:serine kinase of HPr protein (carbohydrate metabolism regulator)
MTAARAIVHGTVVALAAAGKAFGAPAEAGVLLLGPSGAGKSDLALRLIAAGARLVSDDRSELYVWRGRLFARAPEAIAGLFEARGVGVVALPRAKTARVALAVLLQRPRARLPEPDRYAAPFDLSRPPPLIRLSPFEASAAQKVALAAAAFERKMFRETAIR